MKMSVLSGECVNVNQLDPKPMDRLYAWLKLIGITAGVIAFFVVLGPIGRELPLFKPIADYITEHDINANAYYYTEVEEFADADFHMQNFVVRSLYKDEDGK
jgi:hypothetical protein